ncbi:aminotransferase class I/II-fold pyridoxal phosphate-dependent enzyme [Desulfobacula sp.]|uniref:aminotransferase class I/II-fold pyridoxal phosphate-dependent enzyme n=1 Tax=Desulfobacula sp. TaxID=2593537 RepID=UPI00261054BA|nr:aminotransferase class I/II-fold pyridoxal phosphate-dependent enzyme [Desulfobacula sp.]
MNKKPGRINRLELPNRVAGSSARQADLDLLSFAPENFLDTTHFDTVRFPPPSWAVGEFERAAKNGSFAYTPYRGNAAVLKALGDSLSRFLGVAVDPEQNIVLTPGTQAGLFTTLASLAGDGDRIALVDPDYLFNARILQFLGADIGYVPLHQSSTAPSIDLEALEYEFAENGARVLVFSNPNNPTGYIYPRHVLEEMAKLVLCYDVTIVVDSLYSRLVHKPHQYTHFVSLPGMQERVITLLGPSKTESLSGYRLGVVVGPAQLMPRLENVLSITSLRAPAYAQHLLPIWLRDDNEWLQKRLPEFTSLRTMTIESLRRLPWLQLEAQAGTAYVWPDVSALQMSDSEVAKALMKEAAILVSPGYQFGIQGDGHFRLCYARDENEWSSALDRMVGVLNALAVERGLEGGV